MKAGKNNLCLSSTNLNDYYSTQAPCIVEKQGEAVVEGKTMLEFLQLLESEKAHLIKKEKGVVIKHKKTRGTFATHEPAEFPKAPVVKGKSDVFDPKLLEKIKMLLFSTSHDESRPHLTGVNFSSKGSKNYITTTDGFRLSITTYNKKTPYPPITLSAALFQEVARLSADEGAEVVFSKNESMARFIFGGHELISQAIEGEFPAFEKVIPSSYSTEALVSREEFVRSIKLAGVFIKNQSNVMIFNITKNGLEIHPKKAEGRGSVAFQELEAYEGKPLKIAFNFRFVLEFLSNTNAKTIRLQATQPTAPCVFIPEGVSDFLHIIMPLRTEETAG